VGFAEHHPWIHNVALAVNFEGISIAGPSTLVEISWLTGALISRLANAVSLFIVFLAVGLIATRVSEPKRLNSVA
jgi:hypothetical protein